MSNQPVQTLKGFRDFLPAEKRKRDFVANKMREVFITYGYEPLETPTLEYATLLLGKYGEEADKLVYTFSDRGDREIGLRYDQTVPTARVLGQYQNQLPRYFRRYQMQNVFRADKPQKGRFREFTQCDCDIFGSTSPLADAEILAVYYQAYKNVGFGSVEIEVNDRETLITTLSPFATPEVKVSSIIQSIDKMGKFSNEEVQAELESKGLPKDQASNVLVEINNALPSSRLSVIVDMAISLGIPADSLKINPKIARGLDYYTGMIFEGRIPEYTAGSVGGGGRYDSLLKDLTGLDMPAVGFGIGFDRTVEAAEELGLLPKSLVETKLLVAVFDEKTLPQALALTAQLREQDIATELYPALDKLGKQYKMADQKQIPFVAIIGESEAAQNQVTLKTMATSEQQTMSIPELISILKQ